MYNRNIKFISFFLIFITLINTTISQSCNDDVIKLDGKKYNIKPIKDVGMIKTSHGGHDIEFSVCNPISGLCGWFDCHTKEMYSGCVREFADSYCLGLPTSKPFKTVKGGIAISHESGDFLRDTICFGQDLINMTIVIMCDKKVSGEPKILDISEPECRKCDDNPEPGCEPINNKSFIITIGHQSGCPQGGISPGSVMLIIIFVGLAVYLIAGIIINAAVRKKTGAEMIPNSEFWMDLPKLIRDGFRFLVSKIRGTSNETYSTIE